MSSSIKIFLSLIVLSASYGCSSSKFVVCGHRGAMGYEVENTIPSIKKAIALKADMIEIDIFKIQTGEVVVFHDDNLERITNGTGKIEALQFDELRKLLVADKYQIPTLQEVIEVIDRRAILNIELKGEQTAKVANDIITSYKRKGWKDSDFFISSFRVNELKTMRMLNKKIAIGLLTYKDNTDEAISIGKEIKAQAINPYYKTLTAAKVATLKKNNFKVFPWTVDEVTDINKLQEYKVDGIITNYPDRVK